MTSLARKKEGEGTQHGRSQCQQCLLVQTFNQCSLAGLVTVQDAKKVRPRVGSLPALGFFFFTNQQITMKQLERENLNRTLDHRDRVGHLIRIFVNEMMKRAIEHDRSKFEEPEFSEFAKYIPELAELEYGSEEYQKNLNKLRSPALDNHYSNNDHHTEHFEEGIRGMDLFQVVEMFLDWIAAGERHEDGNIYESIEVHYQSGKISRQTAEIMRNTADTLVEMGVIEAERQT